MIRKILMALLVVSWMGSAVAASEVRFASLKKGEVNWRHGPGQNYPIKWIYKEKGYPVKVIGEYDIWRQVADVDGERGWVHQNMVSSKRTVLIQEEGNLTDKPILSAQTIAIVQPGTLARVLKCPSGNKYCLLSFDYQDKNIKGWFPRGFMWGVSLDEEIE